MAEENWCFWNLHLQNQGSIMINLFIKIDHADR